MKTKLADYLIQFKWVQNIVDKFMPSVMYQIGFSGRGPTLLDNKPIPFIPTRFEKFIWGIYEPVMKEYVELEKVRRQEIWAGILDDL
jgi:hypothetical protein